ncbi:hypothetical protein V3C99_018028 [Haemonchus contortus]
MPSNISREQAYGLKLLQDLIKSRTIRLSVSDKGGEFVVIPRQLDVIITKHHLGDTSIYRPSSAKDFQTQCRRLNRVRMTTAKSAGLDHSLTTRLRIESPCCPVLYLLIKTHKFAATDDLASIAPTSIKVRPIVSCVGGPTDRIGWFLNVILVQLLKYIPSHPTNTQMFLNKLQALQPNSACVMESFDVESLYTNVSNVSAMEAVLELLNQYQSVINMHGFSIDQVMSLLKECLSCNIFRWSGEYFEQIRGLAMGQRLAPILAIAFMSKIEAPVLEHRPMLYCRYIDDCFVVCSTQEQMDMCFDLLNTQSEHIRLTRERPSESWLTFLNVQVRLHSGMLSTKWYRKPSNKNIIVHCHSAHPFQTKRAVVRNMFRTAASVCSGENERRESVKMAHEIAALNGYGPSSTSHRERNAVTNNRPRGTSLNGKIPFIIPFVSGELSTSIRRCLSVWSAQLARKARKEGDCTIAGVVYKITCCSCGEEYIGETSRPLYVRIKEHVEGKVRSRVSSALGAHRVESHCRADFEITAAVLARESQTPARKTLEVFWIQVARPKMDRKEEGITITRELRPYIRLAFHQ